MPPLDSRLHHILDNEVAIPPGSVSRNIFTCLLIQAFSDVEKPSSFSDLVALTAKFGNKKAFQNQRSLGLPSCLVDMKLTCAIAFAR